MFKVGDFVRIAKGPFCANAGKIVEILESGHVIVCFSNKFIYKTNSNNLFLVTGECDV